MARSLKILMPVMTPFDSVMKAQFRLHTECLEMLRGLVAPLPTLDPLFGNALLHIHWQEHPEQEPLLTGKWEAPNKARNYSLLVFEIDAQNCEQLIHATTDMNELHRLGIDSHEVIRYLLPSYLEHEVDCLLLLLNILYPGAISTEQGRVFLDGDEISYTSAFFTEHWFGAVECASKLRWPVFHQTTFTEAWSWLRASQALEEGVGITRLGRAIAALSHLTTDSLQRTSSIELVWILLALEALYTHGRTGLAEQLLGKMEVILGPQVENKKSFSRVYNFRSRLLHGDVDIPLRFTEFDGTKRYETFHDSLFQNEELALAVLLATLQWMAKHQVSELDFTYALCRPDSPR